MRRSILNGLYCYELECTVIDKKNGNILTTFKAREYGERNISVGTVLGGISSLSQNYAIATLELDDVDIEPKTHKIIIDNQAYGIRSIASISCALPFNRKLNKYEKVMMLE